MYCLQCKHKTMTALDAMVMQPVKAIESKDKNRRKGEIVEALEND